MGAWCAISCSSVSTLHGLVLTFLLFNLFSAGRLDQLRRRVKELELTRVHLSRLEDGRPTDFEACHRVGIGSVIDAKVGSLDRFLLAPLMMEERERTLRYDNRDTLARTPLRVEQEKAMTRRTNCKIIMAESGGGVLTYPRPLRCRALATHLHTPVPAPATSPSRTLLWRRYCSAGVERQVYV